MVTRYLDAHTVCAGSPAERKRDVEDAPRIEKETLLYSLLDEYRQSCVYRGLRWDNGVIDYPLVTAYLCTFDVEQLTTLGFEDELSDDFRWFMFTHGLRFYTKRPFKKMARRSK